MATNLSFQHEWLEDNRILSYTVYGLNNHAMQQLSEHVLTNLRNWSQATAPTLLFDLTYPNTSMSYFVLSQRELYNVGITPEGKADFLAYLRDSSDQTIKLAVVLSNAMLRALNQYMPPTYDQPNFMPRIFFKASAARRWLLVEAQDTESKTGVITSDDFVYDMLKPDTSDFEAYGNRDYVRILVNGSLEVLPIHETKPIVIGRHPDVDLDLSTFGNDARTVSRYHAQISLTDDRLTILDLDSRNGTYVSGRKLTNGQSAIIRRDTSIRVGGVKLEVIF